MTLAKKIAEIRDFLACDPAGHTPRLRPEYLAEALDSTLAVLAEVAEAVQPRMVAYEVLERSTLKALEDVINARLAEGWVPVHTVAYENQQYIQAMVQYATEGKE